MFDVQGMRFRSLKEGERVTEFNCGHTYDDLNDFIINDAHLYKAELLAITYIVEGESKVFAYCSIANDRIGIEDFPSNTLYNRFRKKRFVNSKRIKHYPAIKICRLGVDIDYQTMGLGSKIIDMIKWYFLNDSRSGCRYLTVDAHKDAVEFYQKNGFVTLTDEYLSKDDDTVLMYYDLMILKKAM